MKVTIRFVAALIIVTVTGVAVVLAASNLIVLNHTATVTTGSTLGAIDEGSTSPTVCPGTGYGLGPLTIAWSSIAQGSTARHFLCVQNQGTAPDTVTVLGSPPLGYGTITSPQNRTSLAPTATLIVELDWAMPGTAPVGPVPSFSTSVT